MLAVDLWPHFFCIFLAHLVRTVGREAALPTLFGEETLPDVYLCSE